MISVEEARKILQTHQISFGNEEVHFSNSAGRILAEDVVADRDFPPYDRATMDGIVISSGDWEKGLRSYPIAGEQFAGAPQPELKPGTCMEIMTGAVVPTEADVVIRYEDISVEDGQAVVHIDQVKEWMNVHRQGVDAPAGKVLIGKGKRISYGDIGILTSVGKVNVGVKRLPKVAVISTGDELVEPDKTPLLHQVRKSNIHVLSTLLQKDGMVGEPFHLDDDREEILAELSDLLDQVDVVLMSGGVSKGKRDYIPEVLESLGVKKHFHRVMQRPGKPLWFGSNEKATVFGFPGNPVSTVACYLVYFRYWLHHCMGMSPPASSAQLTGEVHFEKDLTYFVPVSVSNQEGVQLATPLFGHGSGDLVSLSQADGFLELVRGKTVFKKGEVYKVHSF